MIKRILLAIVMLCALPVWAANTNIATGTSTFNCNSDCGGACAAGDTLTLLGTSRGSLLLQNCTQVTSGNPITLRNDVTESSAITLTGGSFVLHLDDSAFLTIDGSGKWSGASASGCGAKFDGQTQNCGIILASNSGCATGLLKIKDQHVDLTVRGVEAFGFDFDTCVGGQGFQLHDNNATNDIHTPISPSGQKYWENWLIEDNYIHDTSRTGMYAGTNTFGSSLDDRALTLRNNEFRYNLIEDTGCDGFKIKSTKEGTTLIHHNIVRRSGQNPALGSETGCNSHGMGAFESGFITYHNN